MLTLFFNISILGLNWLNNLNTSVIAEVKSSLNPYSGQFLTFSYAAFMSLSFSGNNALAHRHINVSIFL